ncbi:MAG: TraB/GumN family protein, partial [Myxococcales bacterium]|nr:TraB/GumN family protein [Myxococcales bacterium]
MAEFSKALPEVQKPLIDERDQFLMSSIEDAPGEKIVAVVGAAHVPGMTGYRGANIDRSALMDVPARSVFMRSLKFVIPALILAAFALGISKTGGANFNEMLVAWILPNAIGAALLTALAGAKIPSVLISAIASPITSLNPLLGAGMVVGLAEAWFRKPTVEDAERINEDIRSLKGFYRNPFTRVLLVAVAATLGSALGAWLGVAWIAWIVSKL